MGETIEDLEKEIELKDKTKTFSNEKKKNSHGKN